MIVKLSNKLPSILQEKNVWCIPASIFAMKKYLESDKIPAPSPDCEYCEYRKLIKSSERG